MNRKQPRAGIILLVVLSSLAFFSVLIAAYLVFSNQSRESSFTISARNIHRPDVNGIIDEALMTLIRGTDDGTNAFWGEDLLSDYYGRFDGERNLAVTTSVSINDSGGNPTGYVKVGISGIPIPPPSLNDVYAGRIITFLNGTLENRSYRVIRSLFVGGVHQVIFELEPRFAASDIINTDTLAMNGIPRNAAGIGFLGSEINQPAIAGSNNLNLGIPAGIGVAALPMAIQPNHLPGTVDKMAGTRGRGDFDEGYDAADFNNWFLSHRHRDGVVIPSFHRPSVLNYILNSETDWTATTIDNVQYRDAMASIARGTFRPIPLAATQFSTTSAAINERFTGGNPSFALRIPLLMQAGSHARFDQLARALIGDGTPAGLPYDVDNDSDGFADSIWIDLRLPLITAPDGKLLRPLVAPMIEDLSARLNLNAHHNRALNATTPGLESNLALWAGTRGQYGAATTINTRTVFRGLGYGPADIAFPEADLVPLLTQRYQSQSGASIINPAPGRDIADGLDVLRFGNRQPIHTARAGYGYSSDPFGRGGIAIGRSGQLVAAVSGTRIAADNTTTVNVMEAVDEAVNDPYESDPTGRLGGDSLFTHDELEAILRSNEFDQDLLPERLRSQLAALLQTNPEIARSLTTTSVSDDSAPAFSQTPLFKSPFATLRNEFPAVPDALVASLVAPELRLGRKLDVNRRFGNGVDDTAPPNSVIDEPTEIFAETAVSPVIDAFRVPAGSNQTVPSNFTGYSPNYQFGESVTGRELYARHLYILMMILTRDYQFPVLDTTTPTNPALYRARKLAQWAVNVVDYRDPDSIMTRFVFDPDPFDASGWSPDATNLENIVWGVEAPELLLSESLAFHDVRVKDTTRDSSTENLSGADTTTDQVRIPQGSLFLELYCPRSNASYDTTTTPATPNDQSTNQAVPQEFYTTNANGISALHLDAVAPGGIPVWRIAISEPHPELAVGADPAEEPYAGAAESPQELRARLLDSASFEPSNPDELDSTAPPVQLHRFIWFRNFTSTVGGIKPLTDLVPDMVNRENDVFFAPNSVNGTLFSGNYSLVPGQFLAIAPRLATNLGSEVFTAVPLKPSDHRFVATPSVGVLQYQYDGSAGGTQTTPALGNVSPARYPVSQPIVIGTFPPPGWTPGVFDNNFVGLNISEPMPNSVSYYPQPSLRYGGATNANYPRTDAYLDYSATDNTALNEPLDVRPVYERIPRSTLAPGEPFLGTVPEYCSVFLQRLADPLQAYNSITNPYRTVDWMPIDLTVFSGEELDSTIVNPPTVVDYARRSRQRDGKIGAVDQNALFSYSTSNPADELVPLGTTPNYFSFPGNTPFYNSLSFLNTAEFPVNPAVGGFTGFSASVGSDASATAVRGTDRGQPQIPYAIHPWLNRDFATPLELMMVPACSQGRLFEEFTTVPTGVDPIVFPTDRTNIAEFHGAFRHLLNFFHSDRDSNEAAGFVRLFDYVHTLPPFRGEVEVILPSSVATSPDLNPLLAAPFNIKYGNIRNGRINLNTLSEFPVWRGLMQGHMFGTEYTNPASGGVATQLAFDDFTLARRGYVPVPETRVTSPGPYNYDPNHLDPLFPTQFAGMFRDAVSARLAPEVRDPTATARLRRRPVNGTLLRGNGALDTNDPDQGGSVNVGPQFVRGAAKSPTWNTGVTPPVDPHLDRNRNSFMRYQTLMRMPNLVSDNSQVFLVRLTLGFFEVDANNVDSLGAEYGESTGEARRHNAMFIIDRSIPVGFVPGMDLNSRNTVIFERYYQ